MECVKYCIYTISTPKKIIYNIDDMTLLNRVKNINVVEVNLEYQDALNKLAILKLNKEVSYGYASN